MSSHPTLSRQPHPLWSHLRSSPCHCSGLGMWFSIGVPGYLSEGTTGLAPAVSSIHQLYIMKRGDAEGHSSSPLQRGKLRPLERLWIPDFLGFWTLLFAPNMAYTNSPPPLQGFSGQIPGLPLLWQQQLTRPLLWGFPQGPCPERRQKGLPPRGTRESGEK